MSDEQEPTETSKAAAAFHEYCLLGADRSLVKLAQMWGKSRAYVGQLERWSSNHRWQERVRQYDEDLAKVQAKALEEAIVAERKNVLQSRYALMHKRVQKLDEIVDKLIGYLDSKDNIWLPDVKAIGNGPNAERVDLVQFNAALFHEIRAHFADIAAELGERVKMTKNDTTHHLPKEYINTPD